MSLALDDVLGSTYLTGLIEDIKTGIPDVLPAGYSKVTQTVVRDQGRYVRMAGVRKTARRVEYGAPSRPRELQPIGDFPVKLLHVFEHIQLKYTDYMSLRGYTSYGPPGLARDEIKRQARLFRQLFDNTRVSLIHSALAKGVIYWDVNGNLLPSSSGAYHTTDYGISANNKNQLNGIITASWATASTDIPSQIIALQERAIQLTGFPIKYAFYGTKIPNYMMANTLVQAYLSRNPVKAQQWFDGGYIPDGLFGLTWVPANMAFYQDADGNNQKWWGDDNITFAPDPDGTYELLQGTYGVPTSFQPFAGLVEAMNSIEEKAGMFGYAIPTMNPIGAEMHFGDTILPVITVPDAYFLADVTP